MVRLPAGWDNSLHPTPPRPLFIVLSGEAEGEASDGTIMTLTAVDALLIKDTNGKGHKQQRTQTAKDTPPQ